MNRTLIALSLAAAAMAAPLFAPAAARASCSDRKATGAILGGVGGALIGNSISRGGGGAILGGLGGAVLGHEIAKSGCRHERYAYYRGYRGSAPAARRSEPSVYYNQYGEPVSPAPPPGSAATPVGYSAIGGPVCHTETQSYYDQRGLLVHAPVKVCAR